MKPARKVVVDGVELWRCSTCKELKPASEYHKIKRKSGVLYPASRCKPCDREYLPPAYRAYLEQYPPGMRERVMAFGTRKGKS